MMTFPTIHVDVVKSPHGLTQQIHALAPRRFSEHVVEHQAQDHFDGMILPQGRAQHIHARAPCKFTNPVVEHHPHDHMAGCPVRGPSQSSGKLEQSV